MNRKRNVKIRIKIIAVITALILCYLAVFFAYYPHYKATRTSVEINDPEPDTIAVMSANVRYINEKDLLKKSWFYRADLVIKNIEDKAPSIIGFQEVTRVHYSYLTARLTQYDSVIEYRDATPIAESCPIFYRSDLYTLKEKGSFWLSETPEVMSKSWGSNQNRICSYVILEEISSGKVFVVFNTHLDNVSDEARINGIGVVLDKIKQFGGYPSIIMGDFNAEENSQTYKSVTETFYDAKYRSPDQPPDVSATYQGFGKRLEEGSIDYFMISKKNIEVKSYEIVKTLYDGVYPSDHFPIFTELKLTGK